MNAVYSVTVSQLLEALHAASGDLLISDPGPPLRAAYRRAINQAITGNAVPAGFVLRHTGRDRGDLRIRLVDAETAAQEASRPARVVVPVIGEVLPHALDALAVVGPSAGFSSAGWERALRVLAAITVEAAARGHGFAVRADPGVFFSLTVQEEPQEFELAEQTERRIVPDDSALTTVKYDWQRVATRPAMVPTGRLLIRTAERYGGRQWADRSRWQLEDKLGAVLALAEDRGREAAAKRERARERAHQQRQQWEQAIPRAHTLHAAAVNRERLEAQVQAWRRAQDYREYAAALRAYGNATTTVEASARLQEWIGWIEREAATLDPLQAIEEMRFIVPEHASSADLDPYMPKGMTVLRPPSND